VRLDEWEKLYRAAADFKDLACWRWMHDSDLFGVQDPESGEVGYCCVMGNLGEFLGLAVYLGAEGLEAYVKIAMEAVGEGDPEALFAQKCLMASFEGRDWMEKPDLQIIKQLGLKFRGPQAWPVFRCHDPGYVPWYLNGDQVRFLTLALEQTIEVATRLKTNRGLLKPPEEDLLLVRVREGTGQGGQWRDIWLPAPPPPIKSIPDTVDELTLHRVEKARRPKQGSWEVDVFYAPAAVTEGPRPSYPRVSLVVDCDSGLVLNVDLGPAMQSWEEIRGQFLKFVEASKQLPKTILVCREELERLLFPVTERLGIDLVLADELETLEDVRAHLFAFLQR